MTPKGLVAGVDYPILYPQPVEDQGQIDKYAKQFAQELAERVLLTERGNAYISLCTYDQDSKVAVCPVCFRILAGFVAQADEDEIDVSEIEGLTEAIGGVVDGHYARHKTGGV